MYSNRFAYEIEMASSTELSHNTESLVEKTQKLEEFIACLEEEKLKIEAFKRELPLCMQLLTNATEASRQELQSQRMKQLSADKSNWMASATLWSDQVEGRRIPSPELGLAPPDNKEKRKARRCWSPHLHKRFLNALHMLGGSQLATPKQITQLMKVEGLTSDEVKSHLQKYRLHTGIHAPSPVVVVGNIWGPPEYAAQGGAPPTAFYDRRILPPPYQ